MTKNKHNLPDGWQWVKLGDICQEDKQIIEPKTNLWASLTYISLEHIESQTGKILKTPSESLEDKGISSTYAFNTSHILYGKLRPYLNKVAIPNFSGRCTTELIPFIPKDGIDRVFLGWIFRRKETVEKAMQGKTGSRMPRASISDLLKLQTPLPPIDEQKRIASILNEQMSAVEKARKATEAQLESALALPSAYLRSYFHSEEAKSWKQVKLGDVCDTTSGGTPSRSIESYYQGEIPWIKSGELNDGFINKSEEFITDEAIKNSSAKKIPVGTLLIAMYGATVGKLGILNIEATTNQAVCSIFTTNIIDRDYLFYYLLLKRQDLINTSFGGAQPNISQNIIREIKLPLPSLEKQREIAIELNEKMRECEKLKQALQEQLETVNQLPSALLRRAFNGEL